jgi:hypothetical protein
MESPRLSSEVLLLATINGGVISAINNVLTNLVLPAYELYGAYTLAKLSDPEQQGEHLQQMRYVVVHSLWTVPMLALAFVANTVQTKKLGVAVTRYISKQGVALMWGQEGGSSASSPQPTRTSRPGSLEKRPASDSDMETPQLGHAFSFRSEEKLAGKKEKEKEGVEGVEGVEGILARGSGSPLPPDVLSSVGPKEPPLYAPIAFVSMMAEQKLLVLLLPCILGALQRTLERNATGVCQLAEDSAIQATSAIIPALTAEVKICVTALTGVTLAAARALLALLLLLQPPSALCFMSVMYAWYSFDIPWGAWAVPSPCRFQEVHVQIHRPTQFV